MACDRQAFQALLQTTPTTEAGCVALARYGCEMEAELHDDGAPLSRRSPAHRILAALAGIREEGGDPDDEDAG